MCQVYCKGIKFVIHCNFSNFLPDLLFVIHFQAHIQRLTEVNRTAPMPMPPVRPFDPFMPQYARGGNALRPVSLVIYHFTFI